MRNPLLSLDEIISKQFKKVTDIAEKRFSNKLDLASITDKLLYVSSIGTGTFGCIKGYYAESQAYILLGTITLLYGGCAFYNSTQPREKKTHHHDEKTNISGFRPIIFGFFLGLSILSFFTGINYLTKGVPTVPEGFSKIELNDYNKLTGLICLFGSVFAFSFASSSYFNTQKTSEK